MNTKLFPFLACFFFLLITLTHLRSQVWNFSNPYSPSYPKEALFIGDSLILYNVMDKEYECSNKEIYAFDIEGNLKWHTYGGDVVTYNDSCIYVAGFNWGMDDVGGDEHFYFIKIDYQGVEQNYFTYPESTFPEITSINKMPLNISVSPFGKICLCSSEDLVVCTNEGSFILAEKFSEEIVILGAYLSQYWDDAIVLITRQRISALTILGDEVAGYSTDFTIEDHLFQNDTVYILHNNLVYLLKFPFENYIDTISIDNSIQINDFKIFNRNMWVYGIQNEDEILYSLNLDDNQITNTYPLVRENLYGEIDFNISNDQVLISGRTETNQAALISYDLNEIPAFDLPDACITDFNIVVTEWDYYEIEPDEDMIIGYYFDAFIDITNYGMNPLNTVTLYSRLHGGFNCSYNEAMWTETDLNLGAGETASIIRNRLYQQLPFSDDICFTALAPNYQIEAHPVNNHLCKYFPVSAPELLSTNNLKIFPVPAKDIINLKFVTGESRNISIYDLLGKKYITISIDEAQISLPVEDLKPGIYIIKIEEKSGITTKKIEIQ